MTPERGYQLHLSRGDTVLKDRQGRGQKFLKILSVLKDFHPEIQTLTCLDIGCSSGVITSFMERHVSRMIGLDIDQEAVRQARAYGASARVEFLIGDAMAIPLRSDAIDLVVCNHIYEHVPSAGQLMEEIHRVLKKGGFCYFAAGNKRMIMEGHYRLPFLSWLPKPVAHIYLRLFRRGTFYYEEHFSLQRLKELVRKFELHDYTLPIIQNPGRFAASDLLDAKTVSYRFIRWSAPFLYRWIPTYVWILKKT
jgi:ubiquinone/menaquinone biosynthesis C-methylase UbiE